MLEDIIKERIKKRDDLIKAGYNAYPSFVVRKHKIGDVLRRFFFWWLLRRTVSIGGRIMGKRAQGGVMFLDIKDESGKIQAVLNKRKVNDFGLLKENIDIGDFVVVWGILFKTKQGEKSVDAKQLIITAKSLRPLPSEWYGLKDVEERYRKRYLDLIFNKEVKEKIYLRSKIIKGLRDILEEDGFLEVETPMLQPIPGGALARPFKTHHNTLDVDFYLRIAPELYLKRLLAGGFEKIFEIGKSFRNEGMDREHNPEFTILELYQAYQGHKGLMRLLEKWIKNLVKKLEISEIKFNDKKINLLGDWTSITYKEVIEKYSGEELKKIDVKKIDEIFKKMVRPKIIQPTFITNYPKSILPLAKSCEADPDLTESFQLFVAGTELVKGFSELNDSEEQKNRMLEQERKYRAGDEEASRFDEDFIEMLEYGMPSAAGLGIGIDRLIAVLTNTHSIKDVITFPTLRPKE